MSEILGGVMIRRVNYRVIWFPDANGRGWRRGRGPRRKGGNFHFSEAL